VVVTDVFMPRYSGLQVLEEARARNLPTRYVLMTADRDAQVTADSERLGAIALLDKPFDTEELCRIVRRAIIGSEG